MRVLPITHYPLPMKLVTPTLVTVIALILVPRAPAAVLKELDSTSNTAWTLRIDGGEPQPVKVTAGGWNSDQQEPQIPTASVVDHVVYERKFVGPQEASGAVVKVLFDGCNYGAEVYLEDALVAEHHAPMTPFAADLTDHVQGEREYLLRVKAYTRFITASMANQPVSRLALTSTKASLPTSNSTVTQNTPTD
jgi:hypothetical protein